MNQAANTTNMQSRSLFALPLARSFVTGVLSTLVLIVICLLFAPSSMSWGALSGSLPFAAIIAIVGLGQLLVVQQGGFDLSLPGAVSLAVVVSTHYPQQDNALLYQAVLVALAFALAAGLLNGILVSIFRLNAIIATIGVNALLYGAVFAVSGGVPSITTELLAEIAGGETFGLPNSVYFALAALLVVSFVMKKTVVGRRFEAIGANPLAARAAGHGAVVAGGGVADEAVAERRFRRLEQPGAGRASLPSRGDTRRIALCRLAGRTSIL